MIGEFIRILNEKTHKDFTYQTLMCATFPHGAADAASAEKYKTLYDKVKNKNTVRNKNALARASENMEKTKAVAKAGGKWGRIGTALLGSHLLTNKYSRSNAQKSAQPSAYGQPALPASSYGQLALPVGFGNAILS